MIKRRELITLLGGAAAAAWQLAARAKLQDRDHSKNEPTSARFATNA